MAVASSITRRNFAIELLKVRRLKSTLHGKSFDALVIGGGHNGLVAAAYLSKAGKRVAVVERRHILGGAAVTEEIIPGFKFSRASYLLGLLRPTVVRDLELKKHGLKVLLRNPNFFTPLLGSSKYLLLGSNFVQNYKKIAQFSVRDAEAYPVYEDWISKIGEAIDPLLDVGPVDVRALTSGPIKHRLAALQPLAALAKAGAHLGKDLPSALELVTAPATKILDKWFESEPLKATLATDAVIGAMISPRTPSSGYVLLHHVMGELEGRRGGVWGYVEGGMGSVSMAIAKSAQSHGASLHTNSPVSEILLDERGGARGVALEDGTEVHARVVLSNATPEVTFLRLLPQGSLPVDFRKHIASIDYTSPVTKINVALSGLPNFSVLPNESDGSPSPHHRCTIHLNCESVEMIHEAFLDAQSGSYSKRPLMELCLPTSLDPSIAPPGSHVLSIFSQFTPYHLLTREGGGEGGEKYAKGWTAKQKEDYCDTVFNCIEEYAPGFRKLVIGKEVLAPPDLEEIFGLTGGNIFHGSISLDQLYLGRPTHLSPSYSTPVPGLYLCGSGAHPGGGVMGACGRLAALAALQEFN